MSEAHGHPQAAPDRHCPMCGHSAPGREFSLPACAQAMDAALNQIRFVVDGGGYLKASAALDAIRAVLAQYRLPVPSEGEPVLTSFGATSPKPPPGVVVDLTRFRVTRNPVSPARVVVTHPDDGIYCATSVWFGVGAEPTLAEIVAAFEVNPLHERADIKPADIEGG